MKEMSDIYYLPLKERWQYKEKFIHNKQPTQWRRLFSLRRHSFSFSITSIDFKLIRLTPRCVSPTLIGKFAFNVPALKALLNFNLFMNNFSPRVCQFFIYFNANGTHSSAVASFACWQIENVDLVSATRCKSSQSAQIHWSLHWALNLTHHSLDCSIAIQTLNVLHVPLQLITFRPTLGF